MVFCLALIFTITNLIIFLWLMIEFGKRKDIKYNVLGNKQIKMKKRKIDIFVDHFLAKK